MASEHSIIIGGMPDYHNMLSEGWTAHGREITSGDAEKTINGAPSVRHRAPSPGSGEHYYMKDWNEVILGGFGQRPPRGMCHIVHNLQDVEAKTRVVIQPNSGGGVGQVFPATVDNKTNTTTVVGDVDQDPYGTISTFATPTAPASDWSAWWHFTNASALERDIDDSQIMLIYLRFKGTYIPADTTQTITVTIVDEDEPALTMTKVTKVIGARLEDGDTMVISMPFDPDDFIDPTCTNIGVLIAANGAASGGSGNLYWEVASICWVRIKSGNVYDSGWEDTDRGALLYTGSVALGVSYRRVDLYHIDADTQVHSSHPYLNSSGRVKHWEERYTHVFFTWNDNWGSLGSGVHRIYADNGNLTTWRPEIGEVIEGPAYGTHNLQHPMTRTAPDRSDIQVSKGGNVWVSRKPPRRRLSVRLAHESAIQVGESGEERGVVQELLAVLERAGQSRPFAVCVRPDNDMVKRAFSLYGFANYDAPLDERAVDKSKNETDTNIDKFSVNLTFEEVL